MPSIHGRKDDEAFRSKAGRGGWIECDSTDNPAVSSAKSLTVPKNLSGDLKTRDWNAVVPALGMRVLADVTPDAGVSDLKATKLQLLSRLDILINNKFDTPYMQARTDLARIAFTGMFVNPVAEYLDLQFSPNGATPREGLTPRSWFAPDIGIAGTGGSKPLITDMHGQYGSVDPFDCFFRQLEGQFYVRQAAPVVQHLDLFQSIPLCAWTGGLVADSIPLDTICDLDRPWEISVRVKSDPAAGLTPGSGSVTITSIKLYVYFIPVRDLDPRTHGLPYSMRTQNRGQSPLQYNAGEVVLFSGNLPITGDEVRVDTVDGVAYKPGITYGSFAGDMTDGNVLEWQVGGNKPSFPYWYQDRSPRWVYNSVANARGFHKSHFGSHADIVPRAGRALAGMDYANTVDAGKLSTLLGAISAQPARIVAMSALELDGFPGFGSLGGDCGAPFVTLNGTTDFGKTNSSINNADGMVDVILNNSDKDALLIEDLGRNCCRNGTITFGAPVANPSSVRAKIVAGKLTGRVEIPNDASKLNSLPEGPAVSVMTKK